MKRARVRSSSVASVGYDDAEFVLEIEFHNGKVYRYRDVPAAAHRLLLQAPSVGEFVNTVIKPRFEAERV
ncbi:MAG TPA: KTSC domain-containing protein [Polyangiaceae bacterium]|nr:KTSC domain-containing protein [Polyangiaceae bacterium]